MNVLVTGVNGDIGNSIYHILKQRKDVDLLISTDINDYKLQEKNSIYYKIPHSDETDKYLEKINYILNEHNIDFIIPSNELEIIKLTKYSKILVRGILLTHKIALEKNLFLKFDSLSYLKSIGIKVGDFSDIYNYDNRFSYPFYIKANQSSGSRGVFLIFDRVDFDYYKTKLSDYVIQENLISDQEVSISVFSSGRDFSMISFERKLGYGGLSKWVRVIDNSFAYDSVKAINNSLKIVGSYNIQGVLIKSKLVIFEINMRISSTISIRHLLGFEDLNWWIDLHLNKKQRRYHEAEVGTEAVRILKERISKTNENF